MVEIDVKHPRCPFCHTAVLPAEEKTPCGKCMSWHHSECWDEHGRCSSCASPGDRPRKRRASKSSCSCGGEEPCRLHFQLSCPARNCKGKFQVPNELSGRDISCERCGEVFAVPTWKGALILSCAGGCGSTFKVANSFAGKTISCGNCEHTMEIPK
jgi:hypothetical protein